MKNLKLLLILPLLALLLASYLTISNATQQVVPVPVSVSEPSNASAAASEGQTSDQQAPSTPTPDALPILPGSSGGWPPPGEAPGDQHPNEPSKPGPSVVP